MDVSSMTVFLSSYYFNQYFNFPGPVLQGLITGANPVGGLVGCVLFGIITDKLGRAPTFRVLALVWILGSIISASVLNVWMLIAGRFVRGIAVGSFSVLLPVYIGEVVPEQRRGLATSVVQLALTSAILVVFFVCFLLNYFEHQYSFRIAWGLEMVPALLLFVLSFSLLESPKWLASHGKYDQARSILQFSGIVEHGDSVGADETPVTKIDILELYGGSQKTSYGDLFSRKLRKHTVVSVTVQVLVQVCGINILMFYIVYICEMIGLRGGRKLAAASVPYFINVVFTCIPMALLDRLERKAVVAFGGLSLGFIMGLIGAIMGWFGHSVLPVNGNATIVWEITGAPGLLILLLCFLFVALFASTLSCCAWLYSSEVLPRDAKSKGMALCMAASWFLNSCLTFTAPLLLRKIKWITFVLLGSTTVLLSIVVAIWFPETKGLSEDQIKQIFEKPDIEIDMGEKANYSDETNTRSSAPSPVAS
ncbi:LAQU0S06e05248g1_1 [Lachancea quebecensis]|uniref:LAQU0S06e05248g1_1 n=1 Tax=Lachancea quebecensis TaxID=1654605 RepID=A0A0P1KRI9_9SACH|nr:LAQU0S06e05248g1_1 [Lachancea quebecensis]